MMPDPRDIAAGVVLAMIFAGLGCLLWWWVRYDRVIERSANLAPDSYHWFHAERASAPAIAQWCAGRWHCIGEVGAITDEEMKRRGWEYLGPVVRTVRSDYLDRCSSSVDRVC